MSRPPALDATEVHRFLVETFGEPDVLRHQAAALEGRHLPESATTGLLTAGLPTEIPYFFHADRDERPPAGGLFTDAATWLRALGVEPAAVPAALADEILVGSDGSSALTVRRSDGHVRSVSPRGELTTRHVNSSVTALSRSLALLVRTRQRLAGNDPFSAGREIAAFQEQLAATDPTALDHPDNWWSLVVEQMWHGLF
ncbi:SUKH-4 family immunity protein [Streptomyces durbertensis]|uniref:SUKH-4 family immunity protein n=2 Tax=Streptomyces durbertensis TaxID=2448886 RepID=A0ABR6ENN6_9ACTN|nr:SUKH-4 family immunity protein [Streptomyces durbertensis]